MCSNVVLVKRKIVNRNLDMNDMNDKILNLRLLKTAKIVIPNDSAFKIFMQ